jgi:hypothetical protein
VGYWQNRRADAPPRSERARTLTARSDITAVLAAGDPNHTEPALHHVHHDDSTALPLAAN